MNENLSSPEAKPNSSPMNSSPEICTPVPESSSTPETPAIDGKDSPSPLPSKDAPRKVDLRWLAGFIDGEGNFFIAVTKNSKGQRRYSGRLMITNTDLHTLECIQFTLGIGSINQHGSSKEHPKWKPCWRWSCGTRDAEEITKSVLRYLITKRKIAKLFLSFCRHRVKPNASPVSLYRYKLQLRKMNRRGR